MSTATVSQSKIVATVVPGHLRAATLPKRFPGMFLVFESLVAIGFYKKNSHPIEIY